MECLVTDGRSRRRTAFASGAAPYSRNKSRRPLRSLCLFEDLLRQIERVLLAVLADHQHSPLLRVDEHRIGAFTAIGTGWDQRHLSGWVATIIRSAVSMMYCCFTARVVSVTTAPA